MWFDCDKVLEYSGYNENSIFSFSEYFGIDSIPFSEEEIRITLLRLKKEDFPEKEVIISNLELLKRISKKMYDGDRVCLMISADELSNAFATVKVISEIQEEEFPSDLAAAYRKNAVLFKTERKLIDVWEEKILDPILP